MGGTGFEFDPHSNMVGYGFAGDERLERYVYHRKSDPTARWLAESDGIRIAAQPAFLTVPAITTNSTNDLYSVYALTDGTGTVVERYVYDPYGKVTVLDGNGTPRTANESLYGNPWTFTGRRLDGETGLMYYRNRMYSTELGRFCQRDPKGYVDGYGLQAAYFVPRAVDPSGTEGEGMMLFPLTQQPPRFSHNARRADVMRASMRWWKAHIDKYRPYCFHAEWSKMAEKTRQRIFMAFSNQAPEVYFDLPAGQEEYYAYGFFGAVNHLQFLKTGYSDKVATHEMIHVASQNLIGVNNNTTNHNLIAPIIDFEDPTLKALADYIDGDCMNGVFRDNFVNQSKDIVRQTADSDGLDTALGYLFDYKKYLQIVVKSCCCGKNKNPVKGQTE